MPRMYLMVWQGFSRINLVCAILAAALLVFIAMIICFEVLGRALGGASRLWVIEVSEYALLFITFLGAPYLLEKNLHVMLDLFYNNLKGRMKIVAQALNALIGLIICVTLTIVGFSVVADQFALGLREVTVMRPQSWWITSAFPVGMALMAVQFFDQIVRALRQEEY